MSTAPPAPVDPATHPDPMTGPDPTTGDVMPPAPRGLARLGSALSSRSFRLLWTANVLSTTGTWMQKVAQNWLVFTLTGSAFFLGLDSFVGDFPILLLTLVGGVIADRHDRRYLLMGSQALQLVCAFVLAALVYFDVVRVWHVLTLSGITGVAQAFGGPAFQSLIPSLVPRRDLPNAIALNSIQFNLSRIIGPLIAGAALASLGMAACFGLNGLSFLFVIGALTRIQFTPHTPGARRSLMEEMRSGLNYVRSRPAMLRLMVLAFMSTFLSLPLQTLLPAIAKDVFGQGVGGYTRMMACSGAGAVLGALVFAWYGRHNRMGYVALLVQGVLGLAIVGFAFSRWLPLTYALLFVAGASTIVLASSMMSLVQLIAPDDMRGRVISIYNVAFRGGMPLGSLVAGAVASVITAPHALAINGVLLICVSAWFLTRPTGVRDL